MLSVRRCMSDAGQAGIVGKYNAESPKKSSKRFNSITKTIYFAHLVILFIYVVNVQDQHRTYKTITELFESWRRRLG